MFYLHTMVRISDVDESLKFYCDIMGLELARKVESEKGCLLYTSDAADE